MAKTDFYSEIASNKRRSFVLLFGFALIVALLGYVLGLHWGNPYGGLGMAFAFSLVTAWTSYYWSDAIVLGLYGARPADKTLHAQLYNVVEGLAIAAGVPMPKVYIIDEDSPNAFATGRNPEHSVVCVTTGLLKLVDKYELEGVVAHEMSHIRNYDIRVQTMVVVLAGMTVLLGDWIMRSMFWSRGRRRSNSRSDNRVEGAIMLIGVVFAILSPIIAQLMRMAISRRREYLADASAVKLTRYPEGLSNALRKLASYSGTMQNANRATAHLFIVSPLRGSGLDALFSTHPPIADRIARLAAMDAGQPKVSGKAVNV
jgi:heat shock protein HtpX